MRRILAFYVLIYFSSLIPYHLALASDPSPTEHPKKRFIVRLKHPDREKIHAMADTAYPLFGVASLNKQFPKELGQEINALGITTVKKFEFLPLAVVQASTKELNILKDSDNIESIYEDIPMHPALMESAPLVGMQVIRNNHHLTGKGQIIAVLETGIDADHPYLRDRVVAEACFSTSDARFSSTSLCPNGRANDIGAGTARPATGVSNSEHGTHVAGIIAGSRSDANGSVMEGLAKDAEIISVQIYSKVDSAQYCNPMPTPCVKAYPSDQIKALEHVFLLRSSLKHIVAVNLSVGGGRHLEPCRDSVFSDIIKALRIAGVATVVAAGNDKNDNALAEPACVPEAVSVGATDKADNIADYSNLSGNLSLLAPGSGIFSPSPHNGYSSFSGTSAAAPHVTAAFALLKSANNAMTIDEAVTALRDTGIPISTNRTATIKNRIRVDRAIDSLH